jgi:hypothetical protein
MKPRCLWAFSSSIQHSSSAFAHALLGHRHHPPPPTACAYISVHCLAVCWYSDRLPRYCRATTAS